MIKAFSLSVSELRERFVQKPNPRRFLLIQYSTIENLRKYLWRSRTEGYSGRGSCCKKR